MIKKCSMCGETMEMYARYISPDYFGFDNEYEICEDCAKKLPDPWENVFCDEIKREAE